MIRRPQNHPSFVKLTFVAALVIATLLLLVGCTSGPQFDKAIGAGKKALVAVDIAFEEGAVIWDAGVRVQVEICRAQNLQTAEERRKCLGPLADGKKVQPRLEEAREAYDAIVAALETLDKVARELKPYIEAAQKASKEAGQ